MRDVELLIPASNLEVLKVAVLYGADAVYIGGEMYGLRAKAKNFSMEDVKEGIEFAHKHGVKVYITANIVAHNEDLEGIRKYFEELKEIKPDALIISDPGVFMIAKEVCPDIDRHISTQANSTNYATYKFWYDQGAVSYLQENYLWKRSKIFVLISQMIWKSNHLFMVLCVFPIQEDACSAIIWLVVMQIRVPVPIHAAGNIMLWKKAVRANIFLWKRMKEALIFLIQKIFV